MKNLTLLPAIKTAWFLPYHRSHGGRASRLLAGRGRIRITTDEVHVRNWRRTRTFARDAIARVIHSVTCRGTTPGEDDDGERARVRVRHLPGCSGRWGRRRRSAGAVVLPAAGVGGYAGP